MKLLLQITFAAIFCFSNSINSQGKTIIKLGDGEVRLVFNDGSTQDGKVLKLKQPFLSRLDPLSIENRLGLDSKKIKIVTDEGEKLEFPSSDIKKILLNEGNQTKELWNMKLKTLDKKLNLVDAEKSAMLPLVYDDVINIYSYNVYTSGSFKKGGNYAGTVVYLSNDNEDYAMILMDQKGVGLNMKKAKKKFQKAVKQVFKDCPKTIEYIDNEYENASREAAMEYYQAIETERKRTRKFSKEEKRIAWDDFYTSFFTKSYIELINNYKSNCAK